MKNPWKTLSSKIAYKNPYYAIRRDKVIKPNGKAGFYDVVVRPASVCIVAMNENEEVYLISLYRYTTGRSSIEIPSGNTDGQRPLIAAKRELKEETGLVAKKWKQLGVFQVVNGISDQMQYVYLATDLTQTTEHEMAEEGIQKIMRVPMRKALNMVLTNKMTDLHSTNALMYAAAYSGFIHY